MTISEKEELIQEITEAVYDKIIKETEENHRKEKEEAEKKLLAIEEIARTAMGRK